MNNPVPAHVLKLYPQLRESILGCWIDPDVIELFSVGMRSGTKKDPFILKSTDNWKR